jgi:hypothetical protein
MAIRMFHASRFRFNLACGGRAGHTKSSLANLFDPVQYDLLSQSVCLPFRPKESYKPQDFC